MKARSLFAALLVATGVAAKQQAHAVWRSPGEQYAAESPARVVGLT